MRCIAAGLILVFAAGCVRRLDKPVRLILPEGFKGPFVVIEDSAASGQVVDTPSAYEFHIPPSGVLWVNNAWVMYVFHREQAQSAGGKTIPVPNNWEGSGLFTGPCAAYRSDRRGEPRIRYHWYYVGSSREAGDFLGSHPSRPPTPGQLDAGQLQKQWLLARGIDAKRYPPNVRDPTERTKGTFYLPPSKNVPPRQNL